MSCEDYRIEDEPVVTVEEEIEHIVDWIKYYFVRNGADSKAIIGISGGKDSTIAAALCVRALGPDRVIGILMPEGKQDDIDDARDVCATLGIRSYEINIGSTCSALYRAIDEGYDFDHSVINDKNIVTNLPARIRMTTLYAMAAKLGGRVCNTCNRSENYVGYSTKYGDHAGDFSPLGNYTVRELLVIGDALGLPHDLVHKTPADGMCGSSDEDNLGFLYEELDTYLLEGIAPKYEILKLIEQAHARNIHKLINIPTCQPLNRHARYAF
jgi:NAD+ synthase